MILVRGVDVGTKQDVYGMIRDEAAKGRTFLWYTTEMDELRNCDHVYVFREGAIVGLEFMGIELHRDRNAAATEGEAEITTDGSTVRVLVVPTNEEKTIARDVIRVLNGIMPTWEPPETVSP